MTFYAPFSGAPSTPDTEGSWYSHATMGEAKKHVEDVLADMITYDNNLPYQEWYDTESKRWYKLKLKAQFELLAVDSEEAVSWTASLTAEIEANT